MSPRGPQPIYWRPCCAIVLILLLVIFLLVVILLVLPPAATRSIAGLPAPRCTRIFLAVGFGRLRRRFLARIMPVFLLLLLLLLLRIVLLSPLAALPILLRSLLVVPGHRPARPFACGGTQGLL